MNFEKTITKEDFILNYWEQKPIVFKSFINNAEKLIDKNDLFFMAKDESYETRLVHFKNDHWSVTDGPFESEAFIRDAKAWTLLNHNLENNFESVHELKKQLSFLPLWLFDDAMSTLSNKGSSVGAHIDNYNVFILQLDGKREWQIQHNPKKDFIQGLEVKILEEFTPDKSFILEPGDMIYIPPHVAHHGISQTDSLSLSLGFKSLEYDKLLQNLSLDILEKDIETEFYKTRFFNGLENSYQLDKSTKENIKNHLIENYLDQFIEDTLYKFITKPKQDAEPQDEFTEEEILENIESLDTFRDENIRIVHDKSQEFIYINENKFQVDSQENFQKIINSLSDSPARIISNQLIKKELSFYTKLYNYGFLYFVERD